MTEPADVSTRADCEALDRADPLRAMRGRYVLPAGLLYLDGNSLGALPAATPARVARAVEAEWGQHLIGGWLKDGWMTLPERLGDKVASLVGADPGEILVVDTTSLNLHKVLAAALQLRPERRTLLTDSGNFPTDVYMAQGVAALLDRGHKVKVVAEGEIEAAIDEDTAALFLTEVNYKSGRLHDMARLTEAAQAKGALAIWDLAHTAGAVPIHLNAAKADFAVGCGYKYMNGGPGAPAWLFVARRHQDKVRQPLTGWLGHADPFAFGLDYQPARGILQWKCSSPPILGLVALEVSVDLLLEAGIEAIRAKSLRLTGLFMQLVDRRLGGHGFTVATPREPARRGSQVALQHEKSWPIMQALIARGVIGDFRAPDIARFGFAAPYTGYADVWDAVEILREIMVNDTWRMPEFQMKKSVT
jgi:kynureninase